ncbi:MAG: hypothetical protein JXJ04_04870 [Spirochaetales bacterium]|nr:hypothetical protein [Spirochaetales bacterium]
MSIKTPDCKKSDCNSACTPYFERNNYFCGKLMTERDFLDEQRYHNTKQRIHNTHVHGWGVVSCLKVDPHPTCPNMRVIVRPGLAIDSLGREICLDGEVQVELESYKTVGEESDVKPERLFICLSYDECPTEPVTVFMDDCGCTDQCAPNRIRESFRIDVLTEDDFAEGELESIRYPYSRIVSGKKVISKPGKNLDPGGGWEQFDSGRVNGSITIKTTKKKFTVIKIHEIGSVQELIDIINSDDNKTGVSIDYDDETDKFILECKDDDGEILDDVILLEQTGKNPFFTEIKMPAYHTIFKKVIKPCPPCPGNPKIILAEIENYNKVKEEHLDPENIEKFSTPAYGIDNFSYRKIIPDLMYMDRIAHYMTKKI